MKPDKILFIDTETGGIDPANNSLLALALVVWEESKIKGSTEILINDGVLNVTEKALEINGIDLTEHKKKAVTPNLAIEKFDSFLKEHFRDDEKITLGGHNITFDVNFLNIFLTRNSYSFQKRFSHRFVDTATILFYLYLTGKIKKRITSSQDAFDYFGIVVEGRHTALGDVIATAKLFNRLISILYRSSKSKAAIQKDMPNLFAQSSNDSESEAS